MCNVRIKVDSSRLDKGSNTCQTLTAQGFGKYCYRCVSAPYAAIDRKMRAKAHQGNGAILHETGTTIRVRCSKEKFEGLKPATKRAKADFRQLCSYLEEELAYTYAAILAEGRITIGVICREQNAPESYHQLEALEPLWEEDPVELPETAADFGGGKVTIRCCYGTIEADKENATYSAAGSRRATRFWMCSGT